MKCLRIVCLLGSNSQLVSPNIYCFKFFPILLVVLSSCISRLKIIFNQIDKMLNLLLKK